MARLLQLLSVVAAHRVLPGHGYTRFERLPPRHVIPSHLVFSYPPRLPFLTAPRRACFAPWWQWQQRRSAQREAQLWSEYKAMAPLKLEEEGIRREPLTWLAAGAAGAGGSGGGSIGLGSSANGVAEVAAEEQVEGEGEEDGSGGGGGSKGPGEAYVLLCPACRADIAPSSLAHAWHQLQVGFETWAGSLA